MSKIKVLFFRLWALLCTISLQGIAFPLGYYGARIAQILALSACAYWATFHADQKPEIYTIKPYSKSETSSDNIPGQESRQIVSYSTQLLSDEAAQFGNQHFTSDSKQLQKEGTIPVSGNFSWKEVVEKTDIPNKELSKHAEPEAIVAYLNQPYLPIQATNNSSVVPHAYFETLRPSSISESINFSFNVNGASLIKNFNPNNRAYVTINANTADRYAISPRQDLINSVHSIMRDPKRWHELQKETAQLQALFPRFYVQGISCYQALKELSSPANFQQLKSIKHYKEQLDLLTRRLQNIFLHKDGRLRSGWQVGCEKEITYSLAYFYLLPEDHLIHGLMRVVREFQAKKVPGTDEVLKDLVAESQKSVLESITDSILSLGDYVDGSKSLPDLTKKMVDNQLNKDLIRIIDLCNTHKWAEAEALVTEYKEKFLKNTHNSIARNDYYATSAFFDEKCNSQESVRRYSADPLFQAIIQSRESITSHLAAFEKRREVQQYILKMLNVKAPTRAVETLCYELVSYFYDPKAIAECLSFLSSDHPDSQVRQLYHTFHDSNGICKILAYSPGQLQNIQIPTNIGESKNIPARKALNVLIKIDTTDEQVKNEVHKGLLYVSQSCKDERLHAAYAGLADAIVAGELWKSSDKAILACDDFSSLNQTKLHEELRSGIVLSAAKITQLLKNPKDQLRKELSFSLMALSSLSKAAKIQISHVPRFYTTHIAHHLEALSHVHSSFAPYAQYLSRIIQNIDRAKSSGNKQIENASSEQHNTHSSSSGTPEPDDPDDEKNKKIKIPRWHDKELVRDVDVS